MSLVLRIISHGEYKFDLLICKWKFAPISKKSKQLLKMWLHAVLWSIWIEYNNNLKRSYCTQSLWFLLLAWCTGGLDVLGITGIFISHVFLESHWYLHASWNVDWSLYYSPFLYWSKQIKTWMSVQLDLDNRTS